MSEPRATAVDRRASEHAVAGDGGAVQPIDVAAIQAQFPQLQRRLHGQRLSYLDNAATTLKPQLVIDRVARHYRDETANVHRGVHLLSEAATADIEHARGAVQRFIGAREPAEVVFSGGTTDAINLVAHSWGMDNLLPGDEILISYLEHHSNIVPWQLVAERTGAVLKVVPVDDDGDLEWSAFERLLGSRTRIVAMVHVSNSLGTVTPVERIVAAAHAAGALVLIDGAQAVAHLPVDVAELGCDFYVFSGHKVHGPTGTGVLYGRREVLETLTPYRGGGEMIRSVTFERTIYNDLPARLEAGTPHIAGVIGLGAAVEWVASVGVRNIAAYERQLLAKAVAALADVPGVRIIGTAAEKSAIVSFLAGNIHAHDVGSIADRNGVALRTGHHCTQPLMERFGVPATARASFALYNDERDIDALVKAILEAKEILE